ncbi:MAG TPA: signal peptidase II [Candidatus Dormibacteraeota bacterium]|nr:signal peptidase II [Candidatus Dormibacteraeota bacterium]
MTTGRILFVVVALAVFVLDRITKRIVAAQVAFGTEVPVLGHFVGITNVRNSGAAFGFAPAGTAIFTLASILVAIGLVVYVARTPATPLNDAILGLILGGTLGNGFDRIVYGTVTDFINFHFWPVFNVADSAVSIGVVLLIAGYLLRKTPAA